MSRAGFTLIEVMIVLVIIGLMTAVTTLSVNAPSYSRFLTSAEKLAATFSVISDEAIYTSSVITCTVNATSISCNRYRDGEWDEVNMAKLLSWGWPDNLVVKQILVNGVVLKDKQPLKFLPSGDNDSISVQVSDGNYSGWIDSSLAGKFKVSS